MSIASPLKIKFAGGDALVTICLWKLGFAVTDPGVFLERRGVSAFGGVEHMSGESLRRVFTAATQGQCASDDFVCKVCLYAELD